MRPSSSSGRSDRTAPGCSDGPVLDEADRREIQLRRFRQQAGRAARETVYYAELFEGLGLEPRRLRWEDLASLPVTPKAALRDAPDAFVRAGARTFLRAMTTGTTGRPTSVSFSGRELRVIAALSAIGFLSSGQLGPEDVVQMSTSSRGTLGTIGLAGACAHIGATVYLAGVIDPRRLLALLAENAAAAGQETEDQRPEHLPELPGRASRVRPPSRVSAGRTSAWSGSWSAAKSSPRV